MPHYAGDLDLTELLEFAREQGYLDNTQRIIDRFAQMIARQQSYLDYRQRRGRHTSHDDITAEDIVVLAAAIHLLSNR